MMKRLKCGVFGLVALFLSVSFGYCEDVSYILDTVYSNIVHGYVYDTSFTDTGVDLLCINNIDCNRSLVFTYSFNHLPDGYGTMLGNIAGLGSCTSSGTIYYSITDSNCSVSIDGYKVKKLTSEQCQSEYDLLPVSSVDTGYCVENDLCPICEVQTGFGNSLLFINDIQHVSAPLINITIPEEFDWDYSGTEEEFDLDVKGYNVDTEYIDGIIRKQTTLPNSTDFNNTVSGLIPLFVPGLVIILLIYFIFRFIKKIF